jgi:hypothetical protein
MLQLLLEGGQGYEDIGGLLGTSGEEVRTRARAALREMGGADPDATAGLTDYLLGKADPIGRADSVRQLQNDAQANELASRLVAQLRLLAPRAELPEIPPTRGGGRRAAGAPPPPPPEPALRPGGTASPAAAAPSAKGDSFTTRVSSLLGGVGRWFSGVGGRLGGGRLGGDRRLAFGLGLGALLIIAVVVAVVVSGGNDDSSSASSTTTGTSNEDLTAVMLAPLAEGSDATGQAAFGRVGNQPALRINLAGLEPTGKNQNYIVWLYNSDQVAFPLARDQVGADGDLKGDAPIPNALISLLPQFGCVDVSLATNDETVAALRAAAKGRNLPQHTGESVLRGMIPRAGLETATGPDSDCTAAAAAAAAAAGTTGSTTPTTP